MGKTLCQRINCYQLSQSASEHSSIASSVSQSNKCVVYVEQCWIWSELVINNSGVSTVF